MFNNNKFSLTGSSKGMVGTSSGASRAINRGRASARNAAKLSYKNSIKTIDLKHYYYFKSVMSQHAKIHAWSPQPSAPPPQCDHDRIEQMLTNRSTRIIC